MTFPGRYLLYFIPSTNFFLYKFVSHYENCMVLQKRAIKQRDQFQKIILLLKFIYLHVITFKLTYIGIYKQIHASLPDLEAYSEIFLRGSFSVILIAFSYTSPIKLVSVTAFCYSFLLQPSITAFCYSLLLQLSVTAFCYSFLLQLSVTPFCYSFLLQPSSTSQKIIFTFLFNFS